MNKHKYYPLETHLKSIGRPEIPMTFHEIESVIKDSLPRSARKHRAWWSNNTSNSVITHSWLKAGYKTAKVSLDNECLVFERVDSGKDLTCRTADGAGRNQRNVHYEAPSSATDESGSRTHPVLGCMKGTVTIADDYDPSEPAFPEWAGIVHNASLNHE